MPRLSPATPNGPEPARFGLCPVRSPLLGVSLLFSLPGGTKMFQFPPFAPGLKAGRLPEAVRLPRSDIRGSMAACASPRLFAACRVLLRLLEPRYPPSALAFFSFTLGRPKASGVLVFSFSSIFFAACQWSLLPVLADRLCPASPGGPPSLF